MTLATLGFICAQSIRSSFNKPSTLSNENFSAFISRRNITTPFEECLNKIDERERASFNDAAKKNEAIINSDNSNDTTIHLTLSSCEVTSNYLKHCSLNNAYSINNNRQNKNDFTSSKTELVVFGRGQNLIP